LGVAFGDPTFDMHERELDPATAVLGVVGELHLSTAAAFSEQLDRALAAGHTRIIMDLAAVSFIDSTGLSVLLTALRRVTRQRGRLILVCANPTVLRLFEITHLDSTFDIQPTLADAVERLDQDAGSSIPGAP
jgi:anti-sigma B factor antagonist